MIFLDIPKRTFKIIPGVLFIDSPSWQILEGEKIVFESKDCLITGCYRDQRCFIIENDTISGGVSIIVIDGSIDIEEADYKGDNIDFFSILINEEALQIARAALQKNGFDLEIDPEVKKAFDD